MKRVFVQWCKSTTSALLWNLLIACFVTLIVGLWTTMALGVAGNMACTGVNPATGQWNCWNVSTLDPDPAVFMQNSPGLVAILAAAGFGPPNWNFTWVDAVGNDLALNGVLGLTLYEPWVLSEPNPVLPNGGHFEDIIVGPADMGGAVMIAQYAPGPDDPVNVRFLQAYTQTGTNIPAGSFLDNGGAAPWYGGASGPNWMADLPRDVCDPCFTQTDVDFETFLAVDNNIGGIHNVSIFEGFQWGYEYKCLPKWIICENWWGWITRTLLRIQDPNDPVTDLWIFPDVPADITYTPVTTAEEWEYEFTFQDGEGNLHDTLGIHWFGPGLEIGDEEIFEFKTDGASAMSYDCIIYDSDADEFMYFLDVPCEQIPEPSTLALLAVFAGMILIRRRRK